MTGFSLFRLLTSTVRWLLNLFDWPIRIDNAVLLTPPLFKKQIIFAPSAKPRILKIFCSTYQDWATIHEVFIRKEYSLKPFRQWAQVSQYYRELVDAGESLLILDLGANIGVSARYFTSEFPEAAIACLEPSSDNYSKLKRNVSSHENIFTYMSAVSSVSGVVDLIDPRVGNNSFRTFGEGEKIGSIPAVTVEEILGDFPNHELFIVKVDIEGFESKLFEANYDWIDRAKVISIETHDWMIPGEAISANLIKALGGRDRDLVFRGENLFSIRVDR